MQRVLSSWDSASSGEISCMLVFSRALQDGIVVKTHGTPHRLLLDGRGVGIHMAP